MRIRFLLGAALLLLIGLAPFAPPAGIPPAATFNGTYVRWSGLSLAAEGQLQLTLVARVKNNVTPGTIIRNAEYGALAAQILAPVAGTHVVETPVNGVERHYLFLPLILRSTTG